MSNRYYILIVDDDLNLLRSMEFILEAAGFEVSAGRNGRRILRYNGGMMSDRGSHASSIEHAPVTLNGEARLAPLDQRALLAFRAPMGFVAQLGIIALFFLTIITAVCFENFLDLPPAAGMLAGLFVTLFYVFAHKGIFFIKGTDFVSMIGGPNSFFGITPEAFGAVGALVNFIVAFVVDKVTKEPPEHIQHLVESVRIPRGAKAVDGAH